MEIISYTCTVLYFQSFPICFFIWAPGLIPCSMSSSQDSCCLRLRRCCGEKEVKFKVINSCAWSSGLPLVCLVLLPIPSCHPQFCVVVLGQLQGNAEAKVNSATVSEEGTPRVLAKGGCPLLRILFRKRQNGLGGVGIIMILSLILSYSFCKHPFPCKTPKTFFPELFLS